MNKKQQNSVNRLKWAIEYIQGLAPIEMKRSSQVRRKNMQSAYSTLETHAHHLGLDAPRLGIWYSPAEYLKNALKVKEQLDAMEG